MRDELKFLKNSVDDGIAGKSIWIPIGFPKMQQHIGVGQRLYTIVGGQSGTGKTAFTDLAYVLNIYSWFKKYGEENNIEIRWIYRSMERNKTYKLAKWASIRLYLKYNILIDVPTMLGWGNRKNHIPGEIYEKIVECIEAIDPMLDYIEIIDGPANPTGIYKHVWEYALKHGNIVEQPYTTKDGIARTIKKYVPNNSRLITLIIEDHIGKCKGENIEGTFFHAQSKQLLDKMSDYNGSVFRDFFGFSPVAVSQFNRGLEDTTRRTKTDMSPLPSDFKSTGNLYEDADVVIALYNPYKLGDNANLNYRVPLFVNGDGYNRFRSCYVLKNSYGSDDIAFGYNFIGEIGYMIELPKAEEIKDYSLFANLKATKIK